MAGSPRITPKQEVRFCRSADGVTIAYAVHGSGPPLVIDSCWLSHLQYDWESPVWRHYLSELGKIATVYRFDERGHGLSDREVTDHGLEPRIADLEAVVQDAGLERFALLAMSQGGPVAIEYVVRHPEQVSRLVFYGSYPGSSAVDLPEERELDEALNAVIELGWERPTPEFRRVFTYLMIPGASEEQMGWLDDLQRRAVTGRIAATARRQRRAVDSNHLLPQISAPTLVVHSVGDRMNDFDYARLLASRIDGARLVGLESQNHIVLEDEPAWPVFLQTVTEFLAEDGADDPVDPEDDPRSVLSTRELEVLELAARGHDNAGIAAELTLSVRTVERHFQNIYDKLGLRGKSARTGAVGRLLSSG
ncbi:alpha/beta fold hydrolase [Nocardioides cynanchi]|uniref:alpha/beta fold hydrolase n=1 Tax=Nocardioides cynanchi TaxID=2558918 RepID=UPI001248493B|nr:alpha/beta fold hydrolase [Nocardioides cynanchi]